MPRKRRVSKRRIQAVSAWEQWACDGEIPPQEDPAHEEMVVLEYFMSGDEYAALWRDHGPGAIAAWVADRPGTRSRRWWRTAATAPLRSGESELDYLARRGLLLPGEA